MEVRLKHETLPIEVFFTTTTPQGAQTVITFLNSNPVELEDGTTLEYKNAVVVANASESWLRIVVGPPGA